MHHVLPDDTMDSVPRGLALVQAIEAECERQSIDPKDLGERFEFKPSYWSSILSRNRSIQGIARRRLKHVADFLQKSMVEVMALAELVEPSDFVVTSTIDEQLNRAFLKFQADPLFAPIAPAPASWDRTPRDVKVCFVLIYERLFGEELLAKSNIRPTEYTTKQQQTAPSTQSASGRRGHKGRTSSRQRSTA